MPAINPTFQATIKNGVVTLLDPGRYRNYVRSRRDGLYEIVLRRPKKIRSLEQNAYFHGVAVKIFSEETGIGFLEAKELFKTMFLKKEIMVRGRPFTIVQHSAELKTIDFNKFVKEIQKFAAEFSINIPDPNEIDLRTYQEPENEPEESQ